MIHSVLRPLWRLLSPLVLLCLVACVAAPSTPPVEPVAQKPATSISHSPRVPVPQVHSQSRYDQPVVMRWHQADRGGFWTQSLLAELTSNNHTLTSAYPADIEQFCPSYARLGRYQRGQFWAYLLSGMSELESSHNPNAHYQENFRDRSGQFVVSRGLLQISIESSQGYRCGFEDALQLHDPQRNLACGVKILSRWIVADGLLSGRDNKAWRGGARYWAVLRTPKKLEKIKAWTRKLELCSG